MSIFIVSLTFAANRAQAGQHMQGHKDWLERGFADGVFLLSGSIQPNLGGAIIAHGTIRAELEARVASDPFVAAGVVSADIAEISPSRADERLGFLLG